MRFLVSSILALGLAAAAIAAEPPAVNIAVVRDGPSWFSDELATMIESDLRDLLGDTASVHFKADPAFDAGWKTDRIPVALQNALADSSCQIVLVTGPLATLFAGHGDAQFAKPVFSSAAMDAKMLDLPVDAAGRSAKANFGFFVDPQRIAKDLENFQRLVPAKMVHVLVDARIAANIPGMKDLMTDLAVKLGQRFVGIAANKSADDLLGTLKSQQAEAVYVMPLLTMPQAERARLFDALAAMKIPVFAQAGDAEVHLGALASSSGDFRRRLARETAAALRRMLQGMPPNMDAATLPPADALVINAKTARRIGFAPDFDTKINAGFIHPEALDDGDPLSLETAMGVAGENNAEIAVQQAAIERSRAEHAMTRSQLLPQLSGDARYSQIDHERAAASNGSVAEREARAGLTLTQTVYDETALLRRDVARRNTRQNMFEEERARLDAMAVAGENYLRLLLARSVLEIERANLRLTRQNLTLAGNRFALGAASQDEVLRWEAQEALGRGGVLSAEAAIEKARVAVNRAMGANASDTWAPTPIALDKSSFYFLDADGLPKLLDEGRRMAQFRDFSVVKALDGSPELKRLDESIAAQRAVIGQKERSFYVPKVAASAGYDRIIDRHFENTGFGGTGRDEINNEWQAGVVASLPLFESGARGHDVAAAQAQLELLEQTRVQVAQQVEQRVLNAVYALQASHPRIGLARSSADSSRRSLQIVSGKYQRGATPIIDVLDAQNQSLRADIAAADALTQYLADILEYQRAIAWFEKFQSPESRAAWIGHFKRFIDGDAALPAPEAKKD